MQTNVYALIRDLSGPRPLCRVPDICSKPRIWNRKAGAISFETRTTNEIMGVRKGRNSTPFKLTKFWCHLYASSLDFADLPYVGGSRY